MEASAIFIGEIEKQMVHTPWVKMVVTFLGFLKVGLKTVIYISVMQYIYYLDGLGLIYNSLVVNPLQINGKLIKLFHGFENVPRETPKKRQLSI